MKKYIIRFKSAVNDKSLVINAESFKIEDGFLKFYKKRNNPAYDEFAAYNCEFVKSVVEDQSSEK